MPFLKVLVVCEMQTDLSRYWNRVPVYISYDGNNIHTPTHTHIYISFYIYFITLEAYLLPLVSCCLYYDNHQAEKFWYWVLSKLYSIWSATNPPRDIVTTIYFRYIYAYIYICVCVCVCVCVCLIFCNLYQWVRIWSNVFGDK